MTKLLNMSAVVATILTAGVAMPAPAIAQQSEVIVFGTDPCPRSSDSEIVVCRRYPESERYRISPQLRPAGPRQERESWAKRSEDLKTVGSTGIGNCSPVGPGGHTGCLVQEITQAKKQVREAEEQGTSPE
jgi:hypothetical protein